MSSSFSSTDVFLGKFINTGQHFSSPMVRERKTRVRDIEKLHELIDSASLPKHKTVSPDEAEKLELIRKQLSDDSSISPKQRQSSAHEQSQSIGMQPRVVVHTQAEFRKKDNKVIQINLGPRQTKTQKEPSLVDFIPVPENPFVKEALFEIEKLPTPRTTVQDRKPQTGRKTPSSQQEFIPVSAPKNEEEHFPEFLPVRPEPVTTQSPIKMKPTRTKERTQKGASSKPEKKGFFLVTHREQNEMPSFEPAGFEPIEADIKEPMRFEMEHKVLEESKQKKSEEKKAKHDVKKIEKEAKYKIEGQEKRFRMEIAEVKQKQKQEQLQKEREEEQAVIKAKEEKRKERHLQKEQEKKARFELIERQKKEKADRIQKKIDEQKARIEVRDKKKEAKRLAKEHDRKLKLEWIEFQHQQRQTQKRKDFEQKKAAIEAKEKEKDEQRLLREREAALRHEQVVMLKKEKEDLHVKKIEAKKAKQVAKLKEKEAKRLAKEKEIKLKIETLQAQQKQREEEKRRGTEQKQAAAQAAEKQHEEQRLLKEMEEKSQVELLERQHKKKKQLETKQTKKEEKTLPMTISRSKEKVEPKHRTPPMTGGKPEKIRKSFFGRKKEEQHIPSKRASFETVTQKDLKDHHPTTLLQPSVTSTQKQIEQEKKREQKRLEKERREHARLEYLEAKKKQKEQKLQKKLEEKQRAHLFKSKTANKAVWKPKEPDGTHLKKEQKIKEREAQKLLKEEQRKKEQAIAVKERAEREREKQELKHRKIEEKEEREHISRLSFGKARGTEFIDEKKQVEQQKQTMTLVRIAAEEKELHRTKAFERKMEKEQRKKEKEERKYKMKEEEKAKKHMDLHMKEEIIKEKSMDQPLERNDPFVGFDSIDQETANILGNTGYTTIEKLGQATVKDLVKIGLKKKVAQRIIAECSEFVEWQVFDTIEHF